MRNLLIVGAGGCVGTVLRYGMGLLVGKISGAEHFPFATLSVNVLGCLAIGLVAGWSETATMVPLNTRLFVMMGLLGGFTTFSSFGYETVEFLRDGRLLWAMVNVCTQVVLGLLAVGLGLKITG